jgi:hypothetical protein
MIFRYLYGVCTLYMYVLIIRTYTYTYTLYMYIAIITFMVDNTWKSSIQGYGYGREDVAQSQCEAESTD